MLQHALCGRQGPANAQQTPVKQLPPQQTLFGPHWAVLVHGTHVPPALQIGAGFPQSPLSQQSRHTPWPPITQQFGIGSAHPGVLPVQHDAFGMHRVPQGLKPLAHWHRPLTQFALAGQVTQMLPLLPQLPLVGGVMQGPFAVSQQPLGQLC